MGYTHYWYQKRDCPPDAWKAILDDARQIIETSGVPLLWEDGQPDKKPELSDVQIRFNGIGDDSHETFLVTRAQGPKPPYMREEEWRREGTFDFCKTARKPYDDVCTAILAVMAHRAPDVWTIRSDGTESEWGPGLKLAKKATDLDVAYPVQHDDED